MGKTEGQLSMEQTFSRGGREGIRESHRSPGGGEEKRPFQKELVSDD